jgi:hypothetical protein
MATNQPGIGGEQAGGDWFHPIDGRSASLPRDSADGAKTGNQPSDAQPQLTDCVDGVCPVPWVKPNSFLKPQIDIATTCDEIKELLLSKNKKYGNSALEPVRIFSRADAREQLLVRIDDKLSRIQKGVGLVATDEDVIMDLIGYLVLLKVSFKN